MSKNTFDIESARSKRLPISWVGSRSANGWALSMLTDRVYELLILHNFGLSEAGMARIRARRNCGADQTDLLLPRLSVI
jgi:hypothetical protein